MKRKCRLNNLRLRNLRADPMYEAIMVDLVLMGALPKAMVEAQLGCEIPDYLTAPAAAVTKATDDSEPGSIQ